MPAWLLAIISALGIVGTVAPVVEQLLAGIGTFVSTEIAKLFPSATGADTFLSGLITQVEDGVKLLDTAATDIAAEIEAIYPTVASLLGAIPGLDKEISLRLSTQKDTGL